MSPIVLQPEILKGLDEAVLLSLLDLADSETLLQTWAPLLCDLSYANERFVERFFNQCEGQHLLQALEGQGYFAAKSHWRESFHGKWVVARALHKLGQQKEALELYRKMLAEVSSPPVRLALEASRSARDAGDIGLAFQFLSRSVKNSEDYNELQKAARLYRHLERTDEFPDLPVLRVALLLSSAPQLIAPILRTMGFAYGLRLEIFLPGYNNVEQVLYDEASELHAFNPQIVILGSNFRHLDWALDDSTDWVVRHSRTIQQYWQILSAKFNCRILQQTFDLPACVPEGHLSASDPAGQIRLLHELNAALLSSAPPNVSFVDVGSIQARVARKQWNDNRLWYVARQHPAPEAIPALVSEYMAIIRAYAGQTKKVLILDLDNTLWGGIVGEDGLEGIQIGTESPEAEAFREFQRYLLELKRRGVLLAVCSKNNEADAKRPFEEHDGMLLGLEDFVAFKANWQPKHLNILAIAEDLNLSLDSFVFIDDNPAECQLVRSQLPEVTVVDLPVEPADYADALHRGRWFEALSVSDEDRMRHETYRQDVQRRQARAVAPSLNEYLSNLRMVARSGPFDLARLKRIAQLIQRTNQFNLTSRRHTIEELQAMIDHPSYWTRWFSLRDRFGNSGITGLVIVKIEGSVWTIDTFLMSCRVIGRGFEDYMLNGVVASAKASSASRIDGVYVTTAKNGLVSGFYEDHQFAHREDADDGRVFSLKPSAYCAYSTAIGTDDRAPDTE